MTLLFFYIPVGIFLAACETIYGIKKEEKFELEPVMRKFWWIYFLIVLIFWLPHHLYSTLEKVQKYEGKD